MNFKNVFQYSIRNPKAIIPFIFALPKYFRLYARLLKDPRVPIWSKIIFLAGIVYALSPIDIIPEILVPFVGWIDDIVIFVAAARFFILSCPQYVIAEHVAAIQAK